MDRNKLRFQILTVFIVWICLVAWIAYDLHLSRQRELAAAERTASTLIKVLDAHLHASVEKVSFRLQQFVDRFQPAVVSRQPREIIERELRSGLALFPEASSFRVADAAGNYIYDATGELSATNIADRDYFRRHQAQRDSGLVVSEPIKSRVSGRWVIVLSRRLEDGQGNFAGIVLAALDASYFQKFYASLGIGEKGLLALWSQDFRLIARWPHRDEWLGRTLPDATLSNAIEAGKHSGTLAIKATLDDIERLITFKVADRLPLVLVVGQAESEILAEWHHRALTYAVLCVQLGAALIALAFIWTRSYRRAETMARHMTAAFEEKSRESRALLDSIPFPAWLLDNDGHFRAVNEAFCRYVGHDMAHILGKTIFELFPEEEASHLREGQLAAYRSKQAIRQQIWLSVAGAKRPFEFLRVPLIAADGQPTGLTGVAWDLSDRYEAEERRRLITHVFDHSSEAIVILDDQHRVVDFNKAVTTITGYTLSDVKGLKGRSLARGGESDSLFDTIENQMTRDSGWHGELTILRKEGPPCPVYCNVTPIRDESGQIINWGIFVTDLSERKASEARLESLANIDQLTRLPNRPGFAKLLGDWLAAGKTCAVIFVDVDQLARVNDAFGHQAGDLLLTTIAGRLRRLLGGKDILGHLGGGLFAVIVEDGHNLAGLETLTRKLIDSVSYPFRFENADIIPTACAGITLSPQDGDNAAKLLRNADLAMHSAKEHGLSSFRFFDSQITEQRTQRLHMENDLRWVLLRRELTLHYQPQVDIASGAIIGFESLLRWDHPELGRIPPDRFIPLAEESGLILPIGNWVLWETCRQAKAWQDDGHRPGLVAVNISAIQLQDSGFVAAVREILESTRLDPQWLELEITESAIMENPEQVVGILEELKALGLRLSIDDFGTGYSSLAYLRRFPVDKIKIDRSFIHDIPADVGNAAIARMVISIARELEHEVIAEGVETAEQLAFLRDNGCDAYQGYYCSPPVPAAAIPELLRRTPEAATTA